MLKVLVRHEERWVPSLGGLLALGTYPQQFFPALGVTFVAYPTPVLGEPGPRGERFLGARLNDRSVRHWIRKRHSDLDHIGAGALEPFHKLHCRGWRRMAGGHVWHERASP